MFRFFVALVALVTSLAGCATYPDVHRQHLESLPQHYAQYDAVLGWEVKDVGGKTVIDGEFKNIRYEYMNDVEVWVAARDASGKTIARSASFVMPRQLQYNETAPFSVLLNVPAVPGTRLRFTYRYSALAGAGSQGGDVGNWMQTFDTVIPKR